METSLLTERLLAAAGDRTYRSLAELTGTNAETVRRYMQGQAPSVEFLAAICLTLGVSEQWLISGRGPMKASQLKSHALKEATPSELLAAMASTIERLSDRIDRLELFVSSLEVRLRARTGPLHSTELTDEQAASIPIAPAQTARRAHLVATAVPERSRAHAR